MLISYAGLKIARRPWKKLEHFGEPQRLRTSRWNLSVQARFRPRAAALSASTRRRRCLGQRKSVENAGEVWHGGSCMAYSMVAAVTRKRGGDRRDARCDMQPTRSATVRDFAAKLRITAAALGCASQKDLCAQFLRVNPGTTFDLERSYKWMQGRALPRSAQLYDDWALLLGTERSPAYLQSCTLDDFLELACERFGLRREAIVARAGLDVAPRPEMAEQRNAPKISIAVLPFTNMSGDTEQQYFSDGITED